jgi:hypothetical protein
VGTAGVAKSESEALALFALTKTGDSIGDVRKLIGNGSPYRRQVRLHFDAIVARKPLPKGTKQKIRCMTKLVSPELKREVENQLREGRSLAQIRATVPVGAGLILHLSKKLHASYLKKGRGRRLPPEVQEHIRAAIREGRRPIDVVRRFHVSEHTVRKFRHALGDFENRRYRKKLTAEQIAKATEGLRRGGTWSKVASDLGVGLHRLMQEVPFRKTKDGLTYHLSAEKMAHLREALKQCHAAIALQFGVDYAWLRHFEARELRDRHAHGND